MHNSAPWPHAKIVAHRSQSTRLILLICMLLRVAVAESPAATDDERLAANGPTADAPRTTATTAKAPASPLHSPAPPVPPPDGRRRLVGTWRTAAVEHHQFAKAGLDGMHGLRARGNEAVAVCTHANASDSNSHEPRRPPKTAFCFAGDVRTFATPLMLSNHLNMLVRPLVGDALAKRARVFLYFKLGSALLPPLAAAIARSWVNESLAEVCTRRVSTARATRSAPCLPHALCSD